MNYPIIKKSGIKGKGVFATRQFKKGDKIFHVNLENLRKYTIKEIKKNRNINKEHLEYVGNDKYVIDHSVPSFMNHSCNPNCYVKIKTNYEKDIYALRDVQKDGELTHDYTATSIDQFDGKGFWKFKCKCKSKNCRKIIYGDFLKMPKSWQRKFYNYLPLSIKRKYKNKFKIN